MYFFCTYYKVPLNQFCLSAKKKIAYDQIVPHAFAFKVAIIVFIIKYNL